MTKIRILILMACLSCIWMPIAEARENNAGILRLKNEACFFAISLKNGALNEGWDIGSSTQLIKKCDDSYRIETRDSEVSFQERNDSVISWKRSQIDGLPAVTFICSNPALPSLTIEKRYILGPGKLLSKRVAFRTSDKDGFFIEYISQTNLDPKYRSTVRYSGFFPSHKTRLTPVYRTPPGSEKFKSSGVVTAVDFRTGLAGYRYRVNDRFVPRRFDSHIVDTPTGWKSNVFIDYLKAGEEVSAEMRWLIFEGDFTVFERYYAGLPENREFYDHPRPAWTKRLANDVMYLTNQVNQQQFLSKLAPLLATETIWFLNPPWGNWGAWDDPPLKKHEPHRVEDIPSNARRASPNAKISAYTIGGLLDVNSIVYKEHPEFGITGKDGKLVPGWLPSDSGGAQTFLKQIMAPGCREFFINQYCERLREWKMDFIYIDGPRPAKLVPDWKLLDISQEYDWTDYYKALRKSIQEENPEALIFTNGPNIPFSDIGYLEYRSDSWQALLKGPHWQSIAYTLFVSKLNEPVGHITVPLYGNMASEPAYSTYVVGWGWCPMGQDPNKIPFSIAAWELRDSQVVADAVLPRWWRTGGDLEAYGLKKGAAAWVTVISHADQAQNADVIVQPEKLGLQIGKPFQAWLLEMKDPRDFSGDRAFAIRQLSKGNTLPKNLKLVVPVVPGLLRMVVLTQTPAILESVEGRLTQTGLTEHLDVRISGQQINDTITLEVDCRAKSCTIAIPGWTVDTTATNSLSATDTTWAGMPALSIPLNQGKHSILLKKKTEKN